MIEIIAILLAGIALGRLLHSFNSVKKFTSAMTLTVWVLIAALGYSVGSNPYLIEHLPSLGCESIILGAFTTAGSMVAVSAIRRYLRKD